MALFGKRFFGPRYWGRHYWGQGQAAVALVLSWLSKPYLLLTRKSTPTILWTRLAVMSDEFIYIDGPHVIKWQAEKYSTTTDLIGAATGLTVTGRISLTPTGSAVGSSSATLTEVGSLGIYQGSIAGSVLTTDLAAYVGQSVYEIVEDSNGNGRKSKELTVAYRSVEVEGA